MNKVIEVDFLPRETDVAFAWLDSINDSARRILIVDNDKNTTHLVKILLEKTGRYLVFEANDPTRAHQTARNFRPDLIFLDVVMPDRDGGELGHKSAATLNCKTRRLFS
jgi:PleD family two-component response regulator